ncbi:RsmE family RNA methyltransferase [Parasediminibacterium sp. JCM 36343]|uniref:RsmE family RNA methyltransferase n=1 Tax=Parasediminibacterium sp. JCM 36343 TaxID=3374279 RepID=UPI00397E1F18
MPIPYFYQQNVPTTGAFILNEETSKHCIQVLRMKVGEPLQLTDGKGSLHTATIAREDKRHCEVHIQTSSFEEKQGRIVSIGISLLKNANRLEWFLEKATELGISEIIPLLCQRTEKQQFRQDRMNNILIAAMLQSRQVWLPVLHPPTPVAQVIANSSYPQKLIAHCEEADKQTIPSMELEKNVQILIGPEGDFSPLEIGLALQQGYLPTSLGNTRLRTETAGVVAATLLINN